MTDQCEFCDQPAVTRGFAVTPGSPFERRVPLCQEHADEALYEGEPA